MINLPYFIKLIQDLALVTETRARQILQYMDKNNYHPDWNQASSKELSRHFSNVLESMSIDGI